MPFRELTLDIELDQPGAQQVQPQAISTIAPPQPAQQFREVGQDIELDKGLFTRIGEDVGERVKNIRQIEELTPKGREFSYILHGPTAIAQVGGQIAGGLGDIIGEATISAFQTFVPDDTKEIMRQTVTRIAGSPIGRAGLVALSKGGEAYQRFKKENPGEALTIEGMANLTGVFAGKKGLQKASKEITDIASDAGVLTAKAVPRSIDRKLSNTVRDKFAKAVRPTVTKQRTAAQTKRYFNQAEDAIKTIIENKNNLSLVDEFGEATGKLPQNLRQFTEAIDTTKKQLFTEFDDLAQIAGKKGVRVKLGKVANELDGVILNRGNPQEIRNYAQSVKDELLSIGDFTPTEAQTRIQALNRKLNSISDFNSAAPAYVDALVANNLRANLDDAVVGATGKEFQVLKNKYGSLKSIEKDVARRAAVDARRNQKGLLDFTDIFTAGQVAQGVARGAVGAPDVAAGIVGRFLKERWAALNDPNKIVQDMFSSADELLTKSKALKQPFAPKSATIQAITGR